MARPLLYAKLAVTLPGSDRRVAMSYSCTSSNEPTCWGIGATSAAGVLTDEVRITTNEEAETLDEATMLERNRCARFEVIQSSDGRNSFELMWSCLNNSTVYTYERWLKGTHASCWMRSEVYSEVKVARRACATFERVAETATAETAQR
jgi:hypothetical protein